MEQVRGLEVRQVPTRRAALFGKRGKELLLDLAVALVWLLFAAAYLRQALDTGSPMGLGLMVFYTLVALFFLLRVPNQKACARWETALAVVGVFLPIVLLRPVESGLPLVGGIIQGVSLIGIIVALLSLGRSFGVAPADRGLVRKGMYRWIRHPLYATETWFYVGFLIANPSWRNLAGFLLCLVVHVVRIRREERILSGYEGYAGAVRWRMLPLIW
jgi:protein-S-isoprenylcysteine O-methyltransferase Ste14